MQLIKWCQKHEKGSLFYSNDEKYLFNNFFRNIKRDLRSGVTSPQLPRLPFALLHFCKTVRETVFCTAADRAKTLQYVVAV